MVVMINCGIVGSAQCNDISIKILLRPGLSPMQASGYLRPLLHARSAGGRKIEMWMCRKQRGINPPAIKKVLTLEGKFTPVANATILLYDNDHNFETKTDKNGGFVFHHIPYGSYELLGIANDNGKELITHKNRLPYDTFVRLRINSAKSVTVAGKVVNEAGKPQANINVKAQLENKHNQYGDSLAETWATKTDSQSEFTLRGIPSPDLRTMTEALIRVC